MKSKESKRKVQIAVPDDGGHLTPGYSPNKMSFSASFNDSISMSSNRSYVGQFDVDKYNKSVKNNKQFIDFFRGDSINPNIVGMTGVANRKAQPVAPRRQSKSNIKRFDGIQKIPSRLKDQGEK